MASAGTPLPPWDKNNVEEGKLVDFTRYKTILNHSRVTLRDNLKLDNVWPHLLEMDVLTQNDVDEMKFKARNCDSVDRLISFIMTCQTWHYHAVMRAMAQTAQANLIPKGGLDENVYTSHPLQECDERHQIPTDLFPGHSFSVQAFARCLKSDSVYKRPLMLALCANPQMRDNLWLSFRFISKNEPGLLPHLVFIIRACIILQTEGIVCDESELTKELLKLPAFINENVFFDAPSKSLTIRKVETINDAYDKIEKCFKQDAISLQKCGWFNNGFARTRFDYIQYAENSTALAYKEYVFPLNGIRWGEVREYRRLPHFIDTDIAVWCPSDLTPTLTEYSRHRQPTGTDDVRSVYIHIDHPVKKWGVQPDEVLTCEEWIPGLKEALTLGVVSMSIITDLSAKTPLDGLLTALQYVITPAHSLIGGMYVDFGQVSEAVLEELSEWTRSVNLRVKLVDPRVVLSAERDDNYIKRLHQRVQDVMTNRGTNTEIYFSGDVAKAF